MSRWYDLPTWEEAAADQLISDNISMGLWSDGRERCTYCNAQPVSEDAPHGDSCLDPLCLDSSAAWHEPTAFLSVETAKTEPAPPMPEKVSA